MQIIWISGSTSQIKRINITGLGLFKIAAASCIAFILIGAGIHFFGFRIAVQFKPDLAREMGGVITLQEKEEIESAYRERLETLQSQLIKVADQIGKLQTLKERFTELATPVPIRSRIHDEGGKGGPHLPIQFNPKSKDSLIKDLDTSVDSGKNLLKAVEKLEQNWNRQYRWLSQLPIGAPIATITGLSSNYGPRIDPITKRIAQHPGIDFSAPPGTPILAAGNGIVIRTGNDYAYGLFIEIRHIDGFVTKYAHARKIHVQQGQPVTRGQTIAEVGSTGRTTGPHLHYEVRHNNSLINPIQALAGRYQSVGPQ
ncbi:MULTISPECIES: peptidoglycan DD-metalloendopeptidase family protein [unclassified Polynucleobacter]|uniref:peptidoglycan DD-metalloendopeptidase family protein n=1 Tax=unclassified Polynucleobacter TaxID=2640945 RepID=UPI0008C8F37C|nr:MULTISPECIES: peptidoglycan DD-metalloendopeptidase family protein [unclassified Polynucleobacter]OHC10083.1 MAG: hypothetical protein A2X74_10000 [Polynucleobacter sp. GWA2_45_21]